MVNKNKKPPKGVKPLEALVWCLLDKSNHGFLQYDTVTLILFVGKSSPDILFRPRDRIRIHSEGTSKVRKMTQIISIPDQKVFLISEKADYLSIRNDDNCQYQKCHLETLVLLFQRSIKQSSQCNNFVIVILISA